MLGQLDHLAGQQFQGPARPPGRRLGVGGRHQERLFLARELAPRAGPRPSLSAAARLPSTKRRLVRYTVESPTATLATIASSLAPPSAASRICARLSLRTACLPPLSSASSSARSAWFNSTRYRTFILASFVRDQTNRTMSHKSGTARRRGPHGFTEKQGHYLAFIYVYAHIFHQAPAEADMQRHF